MLFNLLLILSFYLPFQLALNPAEGIDLASVRVFILFLFFLWLSESLRRKKFFIPANLTTWLAASFLFLNFFSIFFARNTDWSGRKLLFLFSIFPIYFVVSSAVDSKEKMVKILKGLVASGAAAATIGILQFISQFIIGTGALYEIWSKYFAVPFLGETFSESVLKYPSWLVNISGHTHFRSISIFPDPHMLSLYLGILLPLSLSLWLSSKNKLWLFFSLLIFLSDILTFSRGGYLGLIAGSIFALFYFFVKKGEKYKWPAVIFSFIILAAFAVPGPISSRLLASFNFKEGSNIGRIDMWKEAGKTILDHPLTGVGIGNFPLEVNPLSSYREPIYAHNTYLDISAEAGILAGLAWIGILFFSFRNFVKKSKEDIIYLGSAASIVIFSIHSIVETGIYSPVVLTLFLIIIAFSNINEHRQEIS